MRVSCRTYKQTNGGMKNVQGRIRIVKGDLGQARMVWRRIDGWA